MSSEYELITVFAKNLVFFSDMVRKSSLEFLHGLINISNQCVYVNI